MDTVPDDEDDCNDDGDHKQRNWYYHNTKKRILGFCKIENRRQHVFVKHIGTSSGADHELNHEVDKSGATIFYRTNKTRFVSFFVNRRQ